MASTLEYVQYAADQMSGAGLIQYRKMFGEYGVYCDQKFFALICDDQLFIKITEAAAPLMKDCPKAPPYEGSRDYYLIEDLDRREWLEEVVRVTCEALPLPKPKVRKKKAQEQK